MSEKRSRKYNNLKESKESKRTIVLAKKEEKDDDHSAHDHAIKSDPSKPKLLVKPKSDNQPVPITIATREGSENLSSSPTQKNVTLTKELLVQATVDPPADKALKLLQPIDIVTNHYHLNTAALSYLNDGNDNFFVVGIIGGQGSGKSTFLNLLCPIDKDVVDLKQHYFNDKNGTFRTQQKDQSSATPTTEGIQMFITGNRTILLDCSPVLCNPYMKKDAVQSEIDDLKMLIFLLSVCHLLIVVQDELVNVNLLRLLQCAEMMKPNLDKETTDEYYPNVMFIQNMAEPRDFSLNAKSQVDAMYKKFFQLSKLKISPGSVPTGQEKSSRSVNYFVFPEVGVKQTKLYPRGDKDINSLVEDFRRRVFMSPKKPMQILPQPAPIFTEKSWSTLVTNVWESHKSNYFLRKYENFKEKEWSTNR
ncbi:protein SMG9 [Bradysia coprophila]|uniref:protein SMG9 n=1 Tax=Bradysia coprophila TaxID=38358 RepID=UPI00187D9104|nr:protein SMG9 [Bradysia coprophila]